MGYTILHGGVSYTAVACGHSTIDGRLQRNYARDCRDFLADLNWRTVKWRLFMRESKDGTISQPLIGENLVESKVCFAGAFYCFALARFNSEASVNYLKQYLDIWLERPEGWYDQQHTLSALLWLDQVRGSEKAAPYMTADGP